MGVAAYLDLQTGWMMLLVKLTASIRLPNSSFISRYITDLKQRLSISPSLEVPSAHRWLYAQWRQTPMIGRLDRQLGPIDAYIATQISIDDLSWVPDGLWHGFLESKGNCVIPWTLIGYWRLRYTDSHLGHTVNCKPEPQNVINEPSVSGPALKSSAVKPDSFQGIMRAALCYLLNYH